MNLDDRDRSILSILSRDAWLSYVQLGAEVNLSPSAVQRRVEKLKSAGVIQGARAQIDPEALGSPLRIYILIELENEASATISRFRRKIESYEGVVEAHYVAGAVDLVVTLQVPSMSRYALFAERHLNDNPSVKTYKTLTSLKPLV